MNAEQIKAAREALDSMDDYARMNTGVDAIGPRKVLEAFIAEAERATQPAQRQSQIDIHLITCQEARKIGGGLIDTIPADDVTALGRAIYQRILDSQPAQDQVTAVRAVQEGWKSVPPRPNHNMLDALYGHAWMDKSPSEQIGLIQAYRNMLDAATLKLPPVAAPSPQPELSGSIDSDEFRKRLRGLRNYTLQESMDIELNEICESIDAWNDAACAVAHDEGKREVIADAVAKQGVILQRMQDAERRATDAEAKLAAIQSQAAGDALLEAVRSVLREGLDSANVHPCDSNNDDARARQLSPLMQNLYRAAMREQQP